MAKGSALDEELRFDDDGLDRWTDDEQFEETQSGPVRAIDAKSVFDRPGVGVVPARTWHPARVARR